MAESAGLPLQLIHVLEPVGEAMIEPGQAKLMREHQRGHAARIAEWVAERAAVPVDLEVVNGSPSWTLVQRSKTAPVTVLGSSTIDNFSVGPVALRVATMSQTDTLIVRRQPRVPYRRVIAAVDFSEQSRVAVEHTLEHFPDAEITVLYSLPARFDPILADAGLFKEEITASREYRLEKATDRMNEFAASWNGAVRTQVADGPPISAIEEALRRKGADLVVVGSRGATSTRMVLLGTVAEGLVRSAPCDVLVARSPAQFRRP